jgi:hypothetical protein
MRSLGLILVLLIIFVFLDSQEAKIALEVSLAVIFTLALFISLLIDLGSVYEPEPELDYEEPLEGELAEDDLEPEEAEAIVVDADSSREAGDVL